MLARKPENITCNNILVIIITDWHWREISVGDYEIHSVYSMLLDKVICNNWRNEVRVG